MNLFIIYIGGAHTQSLIELHDIRFVIAETIEDTYPILRQTWWGTPTSLHLDAWGILNYADGYRISISNQPQENSIQQLYFVNLGGYDNNQFTELHKNVFVVAENETQAKQKAVQQVSHWQSPHRDNLYQVENTINVNKLFACQNGYYVHLQETLEEKPFEFTCMYMPIGK